MRPKIVAAAVVLALAILVPVAYFHFKPDSAPAPTVAPVAVVADNNAAPPAQSIPPLLARMKTTKPPEEPPPAVKLPSADHVLYSIQRRSELIQLGMRNDPDSLKTILSELNNTDARIRMAAVRAAVQFGSKDAIPALQGEMNKVADPQEKMQIQQAIALLQHPKFGNSGDTSTQPSSGSSIPATN